VSRTKRRLGRPSSEVESDAEGSAGFSLIGPGAVGSALALDLVAAGFRFLAVIGRDPDRTREAGERLGAGRASTDLRAIPAESRIVFVCVPDDTVMLISDILSATDRKWQGTLFAHTSGLLPASALAPLAKEGASVLSFHPLRAFAKGQEASFSGAVVSLEGDPLALAIGEAVAVELGARPIEIEVEHKPLYHAAASVASNYLVTLMHVAEALFDQTGLQRDDWRPLVEGTWQNLRGRPPGAALTGPIVRGDLETVRLHLDALRDADPNLVALYIELGIVTTRLASSAGRLPSGEASRMRSLLGSYRTAKPE
jgi:predicted short-subunit dehydrogenase-like oxidoreductase (DUF2520 family)